MQLHCKNQLLVVISLAKENKPVLLIYIHCSELQQRNQIVITSKL